MIIIISIISYFWSSIQSYFNYKPEKFSKEIITIFLYLIESKNIFCDIMKLKQKVTQTEIEKIKKLQKPEYTSICFI